MIEKGGVVTRITSSSAMLSVVLAVSMFATGITTDRLTNVYITNLPLDEQGNLKTAISEMSKTMLVFNQTVSAPSSTTNYVYLTSFNTSGFKRVFITAKMAKDATQWGANAYVCFYQNNFGIQTFPQDISPIDLYTSSGNPNDPSFGTGYARGIELYAPTVDLYLKVYNSNIGFNGLLTIAVYLLN